MAGPVPQWSLLRVDELKDVFEGSTFQARSQDEKTDFFRQALVTTSQPIPLSDAGKHPVLEAVKDTPDDALASFIYWSENHFSLTATEGYHRLQALQKVGWYKQFITRLCLDLSADTPLSVKQLQTEANDTQGSLDALGGWDHIDLKVAVKVSTRGIETHYTNELDNYGTYNVGGFYAWKTRPKKDGSPRATAKRKASDIEASESEPSASTIKRQKKADEELKAITAPILA